MSYPQDHALEQRLSHFEAQLDRFNLALHQWNATQGQAVLNGSPDLHQRIQSLEDVVAREVQSLRALHEGPLKQLERDAARLNELCAAATRSIAGLGHAESGLLQLQEHIHFVLGDLSRNLQALVADLRAGTPAALASQRSAADWPLDGVVRLHDTLRRAAYPGSDAAPQSAVPRGATAAALQRYSAPKPADGASTARSHGEESRSAAEHSTASRRRGVPDRRWRYVAAVGGAIVFIMLALLAVRSIEQRLIDAAARVAAAEQKMEVASQLANQEVAAAREAATHQIGEARELARRAETVSAILAAPDLVRLNLTSLAGDGAAAQLLWSRTRGLVLSGSRLPAIPPDGIYQLWLLTATHSVNAGLFTPDEAGRATLVNDEPPRVAGRVIGASVTVEPGGGQPAPSGRMVLARFPPSSSSTTP